MCHTVIFFIFVGNGLSVSLFENLYHLFIILAARSTSRGQQITHATVVLELDEQLLEVKKKRPIFKNPFSSGILSGGTG